MKIVKYLLNCPNCGAPINGSKCEYCGTVFKKENGIYDLEIERLNKQMESAIIEISQANQTADLLNSIKPFSYNVVQQSMQASINDLNRMQYQNIRDSLNSRCKNVIVGATIYDESGNSMTGSHIWPQTELTFWQKVKNWWNMNGYLFGF